MPGKHLWDVLVPERGGKTVYWALARVRANGRQLLGKEGAIGVECLNGMCAGRELPESGGALSHLGLDHAASGAARHNAGGTDRQGGCSYLLTVAIKGAQVTKRALPATCVCPESVLACHLRILLSPRRKLHTPVCPAAPSPVLQTPRTCGCVQRASAQRMAPRDTPLRNQRRETRKTTITGTVAMTDAAKNGPQAIVCTPMKSARPTGSV